MGHRGAITESIDNGIYFAVEEILQVEDIASTKKYRGIFCHFYPMSLKLYGANPVN